MPRRTACPHHGAGRAHALQEHDAIDVRPLLGARLDQRARRGAIGVAVLSTLVFDGCSSSRSSATRGPAPRVAERAAQRSAADAGAGEAATLAAADTSPLRGAAMTMAIDVRKLEALLRAVATWSRGARELERVLGRERGSLTEGALFEAMGVDAARPIVASIAPLDARSSAVVPPLRELGTMPVDRDRVGALRAALGHEGASLRARIVVPATNPRALEASLEALLRVLFERREGEPFPGVARWYPGRDGEPAMSILRGADAIAVDLLWMISLTAGQEVFERRAFEELGAARQNVAADGRVETGAAIARLSLDPSEMAPVLFLQSLAKVLSIRANRLDESMPQIATMIREAELAFAVVRDEQRRPLWRRVEFVIDGAPGSLALSVRAESGAAGLARPSGALWSAQRSTLSVRGATEWADYDLDWLRGWALPEEPATSPRERGPRWCRAQRYELATRVGGWSVMLLGSPLLPVAVGQRIVASSFGSVEACVDRFNLVERVARAATAERRLGPNGERVTSLLLLRPEVTERQAGCLLVTEPVNEFETAHEEV